MSAADSAATGRPESAVDGTHPPADRAESATVSANTAAGSANTVAGSAVGSANAAAGSANVAVAAVDLGASSGRVMLARVGPDTLELVEAHRFDNVSVRVNGRLHWDILGIYRSVLDGLREAGRLAGRLDSIGIDSWGVDYGLLDADGHLVGNPVHYRDSRTDAVAPRVLEELTPAALYARTGLQYQPFNTIYQLAAESTMDRARTLLLIPDLLSYWLTGVAGSELTNASTTQLLDARTRTWATDLGAPPHLLPLLRNPGDPAGELRPDVLEEIGQQSPVPVTAVGSHDTASAVVGVPARDERFAFISCGTWSLVGVELDQPVLTEASRLANFTNEIGVDGTVRYLRNVMGLWLLQECLRIWRRADLDELLAAAALVPALASIVDCEDPAFLPPGDMPARIRVAAASSGQRPPADGSEMVRCILDSLALAYHRAVRDAQRLSGRTVDVVHLVGGGAHNALLCQLTADACGLPVEAGPVEATALGNVLVQARALGTVAGDRWDMRRLLRATQPTTRYEPSPDRTLWTEAASILG
jgi:rhamnulokinase